MVALKTCLTAVVLWLPLLTTAVQDDSKLVDKSPPDREPTTDREFLVRAISCEVANVKMAERAVKKADHEDVRALARKVEAEHTKVRDAFLERAKKMKVAVVEGLEKSHRDQYSRLNKLDGAAFDRAYVTGLVEGHEKAITLYKKWATDARDPDLRDEAQQALRAAEGHLPHAKKLAEKVKE